MAACTWDPAVKGADCTLSGANLIADIIGNQNGVRATIGRDPATSGVRQWEIIVPAGNVGLNTNLRPTFGMILATGDIVPNQAILLGAGTFSFASGVRTFSSNSTWVNGSDIGVNWDLAGGGTGGDAHTAGLVYDGTAKTLKIYLEGVLQSTLTSVGSNGTLIYPTYGSGTNSASGTMDDKGTANFGSAPFAYPIGGATAWQPALPSSLGFFSG